MTPSTTIPENPALSYKINEITLDHPWQWIAAGWSDFQKAPLLSSLYGLVFFLASILLTMMVFSSSLFFLVPPLTAGFFLVAPILSVFFYDTSRRLEKGETPRFGDTCDTCRKNPFNLAMMGLILLVVLVFWMMIANLVFVIFHGGRELNLDDLLPSLFLSGENTTFLVAGFVSGGIIALGVFVTTAISVPMLMDRDSNVLTAIATSYRAVVQNPREMLLWAALIVASVCLGIITFYLSFIVSMPVIGYATWHAYRDLVGQEESRG
jgi:uncharacterized membrane protein